MINKQDRLSFNTDCSGALDLLEHVHQSILLTENVQLERHTDEDINMLISVFNNPILRSIVNVDDSLSELNQQLQQHPSILPVDLFVSESGELSLNVVPGDDLYDSRYGGKFIGRSEFDDQTVPVAKLSNSSSTDTSTSPQLGTPGTTNGTLPPITTQTYAIEFQKAIEEASRGREVINVQLYKPEGSSLGFSVVGLRSEEKGELGIFVQDIQNSGIAGRDGNLREGDQILAIDGQPLDSNISHHQAISILQKARGSVELVVARGVEEETQQIPSPVARSPSAVSDSSKAGSDMVLNTEWSQVEVIDLVNDGSGLGFGIIGGRSTGVVVKTILPGGVADRDGRLQSGDHILQIGDVNLRGMGSEQVAAVLRQSGSHVRLVVARPVEPTSPDYKALGSHAPIVPTKILGDPEELDRHLLQNGYTESLTRQTPDFEAYNDNFLFREHHQDLALHPQGTLVRDAVRNPVGTSVPLLTAPSLSVLTMDMLPLETSDLPEMEKFTVELKKDLHGLGITIAGYVCEKEELSGIFVKSISEGSAADLCKQIQVNDRIVEVDGRSLQGYTNHQAVEVLRSTGQTVKLCLERYLRGPKFEQLQQAIAASELKLPMQSSSAASLPRLAINTDDESLVDGDIGEESHGTVGLEKVEATNINVDIRDLEMLIDDDYEGPLKPTVEAAIQAKWNKILGNDMEIIVAQLSKLSEGGGLGISLEGTVDVEHGLEVRPHHYIRSILPEGPVGRNGRLRSGDELLEVNGYRLLGMNHIEVVSILKDLAMSVRMVCARRNDDLSSPKIPEDAHDKANFAARNILGGSLQNLIPATDRLVKAKSDGSLASTTITATATDGSFSKMKSRSLEPLTGLAMWSSEPQIIELVKGERGLGFSILDYQDPMNPNETVIVIRSLVPGGVAQIDGQLIPGDRLVFVNDINLENASLDQAVQALKGAPKGIVRIGVAKPLPIPDSLSYCQKGSDENGQGSLTIDDQSMFSSCESLSPRPNDEIGEEKKTNEEKEKERRKGKKKSEKIESRKESDRGHFESEALESEQFHSTGGEAEEDLSADLLQQMVPVAMDRVSDHRTPSLGDTTDDDLDEDEFQTAWASDVIHLPPSIEVEIRVHKGTEPLGISVDSVDRGVNGMLVVLVVPGGAVARDGHIHPGDYLVSVNNETLRKVTNSQARAILRRAQLLSSDISVTYIPEEAAAAYRKSIKQDSLSSVESSPVAAVRRTSPRSPYFPSDSSVESSDERDKDRHAGAKQLLGTPPPSLEGSTPLEPLRDFQSISAPGKDESRKVSAPSVGQPGIIPLKDPLLNVSRTFALKYESLPCTELPSDRAPRQISPLNVRKLSQARSSDGDGKQGGPLSICVVDGLYSVHSPKGNKVLVGIELSRKDKVPSEVSRVKEKKIASSSPPRRKDDKTGIDEEGSDGGEWVRLKDFGGISQDGLNTKEINASRKAPTRGASLDIKIQSDFVDKKGEKPNVRMHRASLVETLYTSTKLSSVATVQPEDTEIDLKPSGVDEKSAQETNQDETDRNKVNTTIDSAKEVSSSAEGDRNVPDASKSIKVTSKSDEDPPTGSSSGSQDLKSKRKVIQTRIPSFECTCEGALEDVSPEQMCTCASPSGPADAFLDVYSDISKRSSHYQSAENAVHLSETSSNPTSQEMTANQELANTESIFSSGEEFKSGATSPFYSPRGDSPEAVPSSKSSVKMDKEVSANILLAKHWGPERQVEVIREPNCSLGISIVGGKVDLYNAGPDSSSAILGIFIKNVLPNSPAGLTNQLKTGDRILEVDSIDLRSASHERAVEVIRGAGTKVRFLVQSLIQWNIENNSEPPSSSGLPPDESHRSPSIQTPEPVVIQEGITDIQRQIMQHKIKSSNRGEGAVPDIEFGESINLNIEGEEIQNDDFDGYEDEEEDEEEDRENDNYSDNINIDIDLNEDEDVGDDVEEELRDDDEDDEKDEEDGNVSGDHDESTEYCYVADEEPPTQEVETSKKGGDDSVKRINGKKAVESENPDEFGYTLSKVKKKYECLGDTVLIVNLERTHKGLGISLAGHKDRNRMAVFVCGLNPNGSAFKSGAIEVGDEILEVNGIVLRGRCHLNASAIIKGLPGPCFKVVILRRASALQDLAVKPITQFPVSLDDEAPEQKYARFRGVRTVTIRKGNQNLGIMIIEGKHTEVGQGIFISDIQRGSSAEQAGLTIGDMILAVNKDTLLGTNYDAAATLLKKTEGLVTLVVCNPNKGKEEERTVTRAMETRSSTPSRSPIASTKEPEKSRLISFSGLKPLKSTSPSKQTLESPSSSSNESRLSNSKLTLSSPSLVPTMALTPKTSPSLTLRKSSSGKLTEDLGPDPAICPIEPGKEVVIEINKEKLALGLSVIGGCDTVMRIPVVHEIYPESAAAKDGRLQPGDQILEVNSEDLTVVTHARAQTILRQTAGKVRMLVYRDETITKDNLLQTMEVELMKKSGKGLGLSITAKKDGTRVFISEIVRGGLAEVDGRLLKGDYILEVNGISLKSVSPETAAAILKSSSGKVVIKIGRIRCKRHCDSSNGRT